MNIEEYPFSGEISRTVVVKDEVTGDTDEQQIVIYSGNMDCSMNTAEVGNVAQTSDYVISIPLKDINGNSIIVRKNDIISINMNGDSFTLSINNYIPSQVGGISIYASRGDW